MKRRLLLFVTLLMTFSICVYGQTVVNFKLDASGKFVSEDGRDYIVVPYKGKTAHQLFQKVSMNVNKIYKNPQKVISVVNDASITIRAFESEITYIITTEKVILGGYYNLNFEFKDGRVKVSAPQIDQVESNDGRTKKEFNSLAKSWFANGVLLEKYKYQVDNTLWTINNIINPLLLMDDKSDDDW